MPDPGLAKRYASALYAAAVERDVVETAETDLTSVARLFDDSRELRNFLHSPEMLTEHKVRMLKEVLGGRVHQLVLNFLLLLLDKGRFNFLREISQALSELSDEHRGIVRAVVVSAVELDPQNRDRLQQRLATKTGKQVILECRTDPNLIGGVKVTVGDKLLDGSVTRGLADLREELAAASVI